LEVLLDNLKRVAVECHVVLALDPSDC